MAETVNDSVKGLNLLFAHRFISYRTIKNRVCGYCRAGESYVIMELPLLQKK